MQNIFEPVEDEDVDIAIAEALALMPNRTCVEDKGTFVREALLKSGYIIMRTTND